MRLLTQDHHKRGRAVKAVTVHIPALLRQQVIARRGKTGEVRHRRSGDERPFRGCRQAECLLHPAQRRDLEACDRG